MPNGKFEDLDIYPPPDQSDFDDQLDYVNHSLDWLMHTMFFFAKRQHELVEEGCNVGQAREKELEDVKDLTESNSEVIEEFKGIIRDESHMDKIWNSLGSGVKLVGTVIAILAGISVIVYNISSMVAAGT